jgi:putative inorganic carbon (hco3(-)) transporter
MINRIDKIIKALFYILLFFTPLIVIPINSELFEFGKVVFVYIITILITSSWIIRSLLSKKIIHKKTLLDIPILLFLFSQIISTYISIDPATSIFGYYSRFNGGLLSTLSYSLLYFAFVSNMDSKSTIKSLKFLLISSLLVSLYGIAEHFGIDKNIWVQDVQNRVFSTLGQPNWLAAFLVALIPVSIAFGLTRNKIWFTLSGLSYMALLFTKSRSGLIAFAVSYLLFVIINFKKHGKELIVVTVTFLLFSLITGTPYTPKLTDLTTKESSQPTVDTPAVFVPALESGGTESGDIRKIVWKGALDVWKNYPILGSGVETFAYSFYAYRPEEHNLTSEWDYLYNKAHNEFLNYAANTGGVGLFTYLLVILFSIIILFKPRNEISTALLSGLVSIQITNFFGFSVVAVSLLSFLFPAVSLVLLRKDGEEIKETKKINTTTTILVILISLVSILLLYKTWAYWYADTLYGKGRFANDMKDYSQAKDYLNKAISYSPLQSVYYDELSQSLAGIAVSELNNKDSKFIEETATSSVDAINRATMVSPGNFHLLKSKASLYIKLAELDKNLIPKAIDILWEVIRKTPTDAKIYYNLGLLYEKTGDHPKAIENVEHAVNLKPNYKEARYALAILYKRDGKTDKAKEELLYILKFIAPKDQNSQKMLEELQI